MGFCIALAFFKSEKVLFLYGHDVMAEEMGHSVRDEVVETDGACM